MVPRGQRASAGGQRAAILTPAGMGSCHCVVPCNLSTCTRPCNQGGSTRAHSPAGQGSSGGATLRPPADEVQLALAAGSSTPPAASARVYMLRGDCYARQGSCTLRLSGGPSVHATGLQLSPPRPLASLQA